MLIANHFPRSAQQRGFTLIEMAMVLGIIALIIGGILGGQELMRGSDLQKVQVDIQSYYSAFNSFRQKYNSLPGDMPDATTYWSVATNGDGTNKIDSTTEMFQSWYQLSQAGMIQGYYTGVASDPAVGGTNAPRASVTGVIVQARYSQSCALAGEAALGNLLEIGTIPSGSGGVANGAIWLNSSETQSIDQKMDDGYACRGKYRAVGWGGLGCPIWTATTGDYDLTATSLTCGINYFIDR
jgi:prepilin-type N-terminal cleavage/methylation domain-containing protein